MRAGVLAALLPLAGDALAATAGPLVATATIRPPSQRVEVRVELDLPKPRPASIELLALPLDLPLDGAGIVELRVSLDGEPVEVRSLDEASAAAPAVERSRPRRLGWEIRLPEQPADAVRDPNVDPLIEEQAAGPNAAPRLRIDYAVERSVSVASDRLRAAIPLIVPREPTLATAFEAHVTIPPEWSVYAAFPSELARGGGDGRHTVSLPTATSVLRIEARRGGAPLVTLERGLDAIALAALAATIAIGAARLRREVASR